MKNSDSALDAFKATRAGAIVVAFCAERASEMRTLTAHALTPVRMLEGLPLDVKRELGGRHSNSQCGKIVRDTIADTHVPSGDREKKLRGPTFKTGALYVRRP